MLAIITQYMPATNKLGARIIARAGKHKVTIPFPYVSSDMEICHREAAVAMCKKLCLTGTLIAGDLPDENGFAFLCLSKEEEGS